MYSCAGLSGADEDSHRNLVQWSCLILQDDKCGDGSLPADAKNHFSMGIHLADYTSLHSCTAYSGEVFVQALFTRGQYNHCNQRGEGIKVFLKTTRMGSVTTIRVIVSACSPRA